ncbi:MAG: glycoside hydrolase family 3 protein, partial [Bacteroidota bacterium]
MKRLLMFLVMLITLSFVLRADNGFAPPFINSKSERWADSMLSALSQEEKIAQLIMVAAWSNKDSAHIKEVESLINDWHIGGLIFFQGGPVRQALLTNHYQSISKTPLLIGIDGEWGVSMRLDSTIRYPRQMTLAANPDDSAVYRMGRQIARECKRLGVHINFAPVADINSNPENPVIGSRSFGDDRENVTLRSLMYMKGMQDHGIMASGKHFPGHGDADMDSHHTLPLIRRTREAMDTVELYPFKKLIDQGLSSMMVAHLRIPSLDPGTNFPSTLSKAIITDLLKQQMDFRGLVFTDALNMKAVSETYKPGTVECLALLAGNDILLYSEDVPKAIRKIQEAVMEGKISQEEIDRRVKKVLMAKHWSGLDSFEPIDTTDLISDLNSPDAYFLQQELYEHSITILKNENGILPLKNLEKSRIAFVSVGALKNNDFQSALSEHIRGDLYSIEKDAPSSAFQSLLDFLRNYDLVILSLHGTTMRVQSGYGITDKSRQFIESVLRSYKTVFVDFGNPYSLSRFRSLEKATAVILGYEDFKAPMVAAAQLISGATTTDARLPVAV